MQAEQLDVLGFLEGQPTFESLSEQELLSMVNSLEICYFKVGAPILNFDQPATHWYIIRSGAVEVFRRNGDLYNRLGVGGYFGEFGLLRGKKVRFPVKALEDTLCYKIPESIFLSLFEDNATFADHVEIEDKTRLQTAVSKQTANSAMLTSKLSSLYSREPLVLAATTSAKEAAQAMGTQAQTAVIVINNSTVQGIVTDQDFRDKIIAQGLPADTPLASIMSPAPLSLSPDQLVFEAMTLMLRHNIQHLPVMENGTPVGMITQRDLVQHQSRSSLFVLNQIADAQDLADLSSIQNEVKQSFVRLVDEDANSRIIGTAMASIGKTFKQKLLEMAEAELGPPPIPYCFLALGSMAREEQLIVTDQDNAIILHDTFDTKAHGDYFEKLSKLVCDGLHACGYPYCNGGIMASNPKWRLTLSEWKQTFDQWIESPTPEGLLNSNVFFDLQGVWGKTQMANQLSKHVATKAKPAKRFLASMCRNALLRTPPLGFFQDFVMETDGTQSPSINIKRRGTAPLTDLIRVHTLEAGSLSRNSFTRLKDVEKFSIINKSQSSNLQDALEIISMVRIQHQAKAIIEGVTPDNQVDPEKLSSLDRRSLKDAFHVLRDAQRFAKFHYQGAR